MPYGATIAKQSTKGRFPCMLLPCRRPKEHASYDIRLTERLNLVVRLRVSSFSDFLTTFSIDEEEFHSKLTQFLYSPSGSKYRTNFHFNDNIECGQMSPNVTVCTYVQRPLQLFWFFVVLYTVVRNKILFIVRI